MPLIKVHTSAPSPEPARAEALLQDLSRRLATHLGKGEDWVMTCLMPQALMTFAGAAEAACYVEVKNVGTMTPEQTHAMSADFCEVLHEALGVAPERTYLEFNDAERHLWGFDRRTLAT